jgi:hypothetical protein
MRTGDVIRFEEMAVGPFAQLFEVPTNGFQLEPAIVAEASDNESVVHGPWLVNAAPHGSLVRRYPPMAINHLHRRFARLKPTERSILSFANEYGMLGHASPAVLPQEPGLRSGLLCTAEALGFWKQERIRLRTLLQLWEFVRLGNQRELRRYFQWRRDPKSVEVVIAADASGLLPETANQMALGRVQPQLGPEAVASFETLASENRGDRSADLLANWAEGDAIEPARFYVHREVNGKMRGHVSPAVLPFRRGEIFFFPDCLLGGIYTHFALELSGRMRPAILCARRGCGVYFTPTRRDQRYCTSACRKLAWAHDNPDHRKSRSGSSPPAPQ